jgi:hypothetical protein
MLAPYCSCVAPARISRRYWRECGKTAILAYVLREVGPRPAKLTGKQFVEKLLSQVTDVERLRRLFAAYRDVQRCCGLVARYVAYNSSGRPVDCTLLTREAAQKTTLTSSFHGFSMLTGNIQRATAHSQKMLDGSL